MTIKYNTTVYPATFSGHPSESDKWFACWNGYAEHQKLLEPEHLLPQVCSPTRIEPFTYEINKPIEKPDELLKKEIEDLGRWAYQMEFSGSRVSTIGQRHEREWKFHRYRGSLLVKSINWLLGPALSKLKVLDVGCHCGLFSLEFGYQRAAQVLGLDLRTENISQAKWLANTYGIKNVEFKVENARNLQNYRGFDVIFCGGLFYHLTFPLDFFEAVFDCCEDFLIFDTLTHKEPISAFHMVLNKDIGYSAEGETHYELHPTYRAVVDCLRSVGFEDIVELVGSDAANVWGYQDGLMRSFLASKKGNKSWPVLRNRLGVIL